MEHLISHEGGRAAILVCVIYQNLIFQLQNLKKQAESRCDVKEMVKISQGPDKHKCNDYHIYPK